MTKKLEPIKPGEILLEEFMKPMGISQNAMARALDVPAGRINEVVTGRRAITVDTAARLSVFFNTTVELWLNLQARYDAKVAHEQLIPHLRRIIRRHQEAA